MQDIKPRAELKLHGLKFSGRNKRIVVAVTIAFIMSASAAATYTLFRKYTFYELNQEVAAELKRGNYSAALALYNKLYNAYPENVEISSEIEETERLLIAEDDFKKAKKAAENEQWLNVEALLKDSGAVSNPEFKFYEEAQMLYQQAKSLVASFEKNISEKISNLKQAVAEEEKQKGISG